MTETFAIDQVVNHEEVQGGDADNRREHKRRLAYWVVQFQDVYGKWHTTKTDNISEGGLQVVTGTAYKSGTKFFIKMPLVYREFQRTIEAIVESRYSVATSAGFKIGMMFTRISDSDREFLRAYSEGDI